MKIVNIIGKEILDSCGMPTIGCEIHLENGAVFQSNVPAGKSNNKYQACELRDGGKKFFGKGVTKAIDIINNEIAPQFLGKEPNAIQMDLDMIQMDGTQNKSKFGANSILAVSMAMYRANAYIAESELYDFIAIVSGSDTVSIPLPIINFASGDENVFDQYLLIPYGAQNLKSALDKSIQLFQTFKEILIKKNMITLTSSSGAFASNYSSIDQPFELLNETMSKLNFNSDLFSIGIDVSAYKFFDPKKETYNIAGLKKTTEQMVEWYSILFEKYNLYLIEDPLALEDLPGWIKLNDALGQNMHICADELFATNPERILKGVEYNIANTVVIKPGQIGTVTETLQSIQVCKENGLSTIVSSRSCETCDSFIVDMAVGASSNYINCGGLSRGERISKYNRLLDIENTLTNLVLNE